MATVKASHQVDSLSLDLNFYVRNFYEEFPYDNVYFRFGEKAYQDVYLINGYDGYDDLVLGIGGSGLGFDAWGDVVGGTVTGIVETFYDGPEIISIQNFSIPAARLYNAALTYGNSDDRAVFSAIMSGDDTVGLSAFNDRFEGFSGHDRMWGNGGSDTLIGGAGNDILSGGSGHDRLVGGDGADRLAGTTGSDILDGRNGTDLLDGGTGRDRLFGGTDASRDVFVFRRAAETAVGPQRDGVMQFRAGQDDIDLSLIDAHAGRGGNQVFAFAGTTAAAYSVWYVRHAEGVVVRGDVNGNKTADFEIWVDDAVRLGAADFIL